MKAKTFDEWKALGYHVIKGEQHTGRNKDGICTFTREQVEEHDEYEDDYLDRDDYLGD